MTGERHINSNTIGIISREQAGVPLDDITANPNIHPFTTKLRTALEIDLAPDAPISLTHIVLEHNDLAAVDIQGEVSGKSPADYAIRMF